MMHWPFIFSTGGVVVGFVAAALVATVSAYFIPEIVKALGDYADSRGPSDLCILTTLGINTLGQAAAILGTVMFATAAALEITALVFLTSLILAWIGVTLEVAVASLVSAGIAACTTVIAILLGVLANAYNYRKCMDRQESGSVVLQ
jgi:hypothetical protein